jgi:predicted solute-binding protein
MRIKRNDLTHYFLRQHDELPESYIKSCERFFKYLKRENEQAHKRASLQALKRS